MRAKMYVNDRKPYRGKFIGTAQTKIRKQALPNRLETLNELAFNWLKDDLSDSAIRINSCFVLGLENFPQKSQFFPSDHKKNLFRSGQKVPRSKTGWLLIYCRSKVCSGRVSSGPISMLEPKNV